MERRKVIQQGKGTLTMSLPMKWIKQAGIEAGDEIFVKTQGLQLIVAPDVGKTKRKIVETDLTGFSKPLVYVVLQNMYIRGDDEMLLRYEKPETYDIITEVVRYLIGFEILEHTKHTCHLKEIASSKNEDFDTLLRRIFLLILSMAEDGIDAFKKGDKDELYVLKKRDNSVNTLVSYCMRVLNKQSCARVQKAMHLYTLLILLEHLGDEYSRLYRDVKSLSAKTIVVATKAASLIRDFYELFYKFNKIGASELKEKRDKIRSHIDAQLGVSRSKEDIAALNHFRRIADLIMDIEKFNIAMQI